MHQADVTVWRDSCCETKNYAPYLKGSPVPRLTETGQNQLLLGEISLQPQYPPVNIPPVNIPLDNTPWIISPWTISLGYWRGDIGGGILADIVTFRKTRLDINKLFHRHSHQGNVVVLVVPTCHCWSCCPDTRPLIRPDTRPDTCWEPAGPDGAARAEML